MCIRTSLWACTVVVGGALISTACGYTDGGEGTRSLQVVAEGIYEPVPTNQTSFAVTVRDRDGLNVPSARIVFADGDSAESFEAIATGSAAGGATLYTASVEGYRRRLELSVSADGGSLSARLEGPGPHTVLDPRAKDTVDRERLPVSWATDDGLRANEVELKLEVAQYGRSFTEDTGSASIPGSALLPGAEILHVVRRNSVDLAGGLQGSKLSVAYDLDLHINVAN